MFRRDHKPLNSPEWLIVGLGNPGGEYRGTRHNVGFDVIDRLSKEHGIKLDLSKHKARYGVGTLGGRTVALVKPLTYMNLSGQAVAPFARQYNIKPDHILVIADDLDLPVGRTRLRGQGSAGGHNGHKSLIASLGTTEYPRIKIGIGSVHRSQTIDHVLGAFERDELDAIQDALSRVMVGAERVVADGVEAASEQLNVG